ncbi:MAG: L-glutamate gamma-semialdehyde dehydrogenase [Proteobacteria bacterium]|nr:L-glutamate gamma-semialdehyde dehydrogenase [Pseudomonadota bacterium]
MLTPFKNEPYTDFSRPENRKQMEAALARIEADFNRTWPLVIGGRDVKSGGKIKSYDPSNKEQVVGTVEKATAADADAALTAAWKAFDSWKHTTPEERAGLVVKLAAKMRERKHELSATMVCEVGKSWAEADGDTAEAIDFCEFYAREAIRYGAKHPQCPWPGERNELEYIPLGAGVAIPPWNFPLAILTGMTVGPVAAGNTMVVKPASDAPVIAAKMIALSREAGFPDGVINFVPGSGSDVGETLVASPKTRFINFTGSRDVGLHIVEEAARHRNGQRWIKRVTAEMGGKDAAIVDSEADLDAAAEGVVTSAFGFQGQKCSACSRAIVDAKVYDEFIEKLVARTKRIKVGPTRDPSNWMGPVVNKASFDKTMEYIKAGSREGRLLCGGEASDAQGYFIQPTVIADVSPTAKMAREEIFGPVLAVIEARDFDHALEIFNSTDYGLTGGVFTRNEAKIEKARHECFCGNFYINRKITGALVGVQPFGGYNMSGTCSKAGGSDYLLLFLQSKSICQRL